MRLDLEGAWSVRIDVSVTKTTLGEPCRPYRKHINILVFAPTVERASAVVREDYPDSVIWAVNHAHKEAVILTERMPAAREVT